METTHNIKHTITEKTAKGYTMIIEVSLDDDCKNGHSDFSLTSSIYSHPTSRADKYFVSKNCNHKEILKARPDLKIFADLHLSDSQGIPMYALENGIYFIKEGKKDVVMNHFICDNAEADLLMTAEDKDHLGYLLHKMGLVDRWKDSAKQAIKMLEDWTGKKYADQPNAKKHPIGFDPSIEGRIKAGYYSPENNAKRRAAIHAEKNQAVLDGLKKDLDNTIKKATDEYNVKLEVFRCGLPLKNCIYYSHTNELKFNWLSYEDRITQTQLKEFVINADYTKLPEGIKIGFHKDSK